MDLKRGVEVKEFSSLPNVKIAKDKRQATQILKALVEEMNHRYRILEEKGDKSITPKRDKLDNLPARMTFRMISSAASNVAMGGNLARKLPSIKGRAMWTHGSEYKEVQAPYVNDESVKEELELINQEFANGTRRSPKAIAVI